MNISILNKKKLLNSSQVHNYYIMKKKMMRYQVNWEKHNQHCVQ